MKLCLPDYDNCILGISHSILKHYHAEPNLKSLPILDKELAKNYKNVVFMIFDGMGVDMLKEHLSQFSFLRRHIKAKITSVFPPTTVAATSAYYSGLTPLEHGKIAWNCYFKEVDRVVEFFPQRDAYSGEKIDTTDLFAQLQYECMWDKIKKSADVETTALFPNKIQPKGTSSIKNTFKRVEKQCQKPQNQFILSYWTGPDHEAHHYGLYSKKVKNVLTEINAELKEFCGKMKDTLIIISADHGHIAISDVVYIDDIPEFIDCLKVPLALDDRVSAIYLKENKEEKFLKLFAEYLADDFMLMSKKEVKETHLFGYGTEHKRFEDFIGDYLIIAKSGKSLRQIYPAKEDANAQMVSSHSGLTVKEMIVPLIIASKK